MKKVLLLIEKLKFLCQKLQEKCNRKSLSKHEIAVEDFEGEKTTRRGG